MDVTFGKNFAIAAVALQSVGCTESGPGSFRLSLILISSRVTDEDRVSH